MIELKTKQEARKLLRRCLEFGKVIAGSHFRSELKNEALSFEDVWHVLKAGAIYDQPEQDLRTGEWKYRVESFEPGGKWMAVVFSFKETGVTFLITVFSVATRSRRER